MATQAEIKELITKKKQLLQQTELQYSEAVKGVKGYSIDSGGSRQSVTRHDPIKLLEAMQILQNEIAALQTQLHRNGIVTFNRYRRR